MSPGRSAPERTDPDLGPGPAALASACLAAVAAIGAAALTAIGAAIAFEVAPLLGGPYEQLLFIDGASRFAAEAGGLIVLALAYRRCRGLPAWPGRASILGLMKATALLGVIAARFVAHLGPWIGP